jgi:hypothetical protein
MTRKKKAMAVGTGVGATALATAAAIAALKYQASANEKRLDRLEPKVQQVEIDTTAHAARAEERHKETQQKLNWIIQKLD